MSESNQKETLRSEEEEKTWINTHCRCSQRKKEIK